jgi:hypothetical protein
VGVSRKADSGMKMNLHPTRRDIQETRDKEVQGRILHGATNRSCLCSLNPMIEKTASRVFFLLKQKINGMCPYFILAPALSSSSFIP